MGKTPGEIVKDYIRKYPKITENREMARKLNNDFPTLFASIDSARALVRYYKGVIGVRERKKPSQEFFTQTAFDKLLEEINTPVDFDYQVKNFQIATNIKNLGIINDVHIPLHDKVAMTTAYKYLKQSNIDGLLINGDFFDFYHVSRWAKEYTHFTWRDEKQMCRQELDRIRQLFGDIPIFFKEGNHEERWKSFLMRNAMVLYDDPEYNLDVIMEAATNKITWIKGRGLIEYNDLNIAHGHEYKSVMKYFRQPKYDLAFGHHHITESKVVNSDRGKKIRVYGIGALANIQMTYHPHNDNNHGCARVERDSTDFLFHNLVINGTKINYK